MHLIELAPPTERTKLSRREQLVGIVFGLWMIIGLFLDGWAHDNNKPESFFTPWHGVLYSGFLAASAAAILIVWRPGRPIRDAMRALPRGHGLTLVALGIFSVAAIGDLVWHELLGVEVGMEALLSPTHLALLGSGLIALSAPLRASWTDPSEGGSFGSTMPAVLTLALLTALVGFFLLYMSPFVNDTVGVRFDRVANIPHDHPSKNVSELQQVLGVGSMLMTSVLLSLPISAVTRRWRTRFPTFTVLVGIVVLLFVGLSEFDQPWAVLSGLAAGMTVDALIARTPAWVATGSGVAVLWGSYFTLYELFAGGVAWSAELSAGTVVLSAMLAGGIALVVAPDAYSQHRST